MRILVYGINYAPELTGIGKYTAEMCEWLAARGHSVDVITSMPFYPQWKIFAEYKGKWWFKETMSEVKVFRVPLFVPNKVTGKTRILHELSFGINSLWYWIQVFFRRYDGVVAVCPPLQMGIFPYLYKLIRRRPFIFHVQDLQVDAAERLGILHSHFLLKCLKGMERFLFRHADAVTTISNGMVNRIILKGVADRAVDLIPNWVETQFLGLLDGYDERSFRKEHGFKSSDTIILYAGNMGEKQGLEKVLEVANRFHGRKDVFFVFVGEGVAKSRLMKRANDLSLGNVRFLPLQSTVKLPGMLKAADVHLIIQKRAASDLVMPSKLTNVLAVGGLAIVTADKGTALYEIVNSYKMGIVVKPESVDSLIESIEWVLTQTKKTEFANISANARAYAEQYLNKDIVLLEFEKRLFEICEKGGAAK